MSDIKHEVIHPMQHRIIVTLDKTDYEGDYNKELKKYREKGQFKGFRQGKVPLNFVKKMVGREVLLSVLEKKFISELNAFMEKEGLTKKMIFQPTPAPDQDVFDNLNPNQLETYTFSFDVGQYPALDLQGVSKDQTFTKYVVEVTDAMVEEALQEELQRGGEIVEILGTPIQEGDFLKIEAVELGENGEVKEEGHKTQFPIMVDSVKPDSLRESMLGKSIGFTFKFDIYEFEEGASREIVLKHLLGLTEEEAEGVGSQFLGLVQSGSRKEPAELNEEFIQRYFKEDAISTPDEARAVIRRDIRKQYEGSSVSELYFRLREHVIEQNPIDFPEDFLKQYLQLQEEVILSDSEVDKRYASFSKDLQWFLLKEKLVELLQIEISQEDVSQKYREQVFAYFKGSIPPEQATMVESLVERFMSDTKQVEELRSNMVNESMTVRFQELFTIQEEEVPFEVLKEKLESYQNALTANEEINPDHEEEATPAE